MCFGRTGGSAAAIPSGASAQQHDDVARIGSLTDHILSRSRSHDRSDLHTFCHVTRMINLIHKTGSKTDLVAVRAVTLSCTHRQLSLRQLALQCLRHRHGWICTAGHTHSLIYIGTSRQRVTDGAAQTGGSSTKRLDLCRMIVRLIFKADQPFLGLILELHRNDDRTGINLVTLFHIVKDAVFFQLLHAHDSQIHQTDKLILSVSVDIGTILLVFFKCILKQLLVGAILESNIL